MPSFKLEGAVFTGTRYQPSFWSIAKSRRLFIMATRTVLSRLELFKIFLQNYDSLDFGKIIKTWNIFISIDTNLWILLYDIFPWDESYHLLFCSRDRTLYRYFGIQNDPKSKRGYNYGLRFDRHLACHSNFDTKLTEDQFDQVQKYKFYDNKWTEKPTD